MAQPNTTITFEIEPVVRLYCEETGCRFNMLSLYWMQAGPFCALKGVTIGKNGQCKMRELKDEPDERR